MAAGLIRNPCETCGSALHTTAEHVRIVALQAVNNPKRKPVGHYTGRCAKCHSTNLGEDNLVYWCKDCGATLHGNG